MQDLLGAGYHLSQSRFIVYASCSVGRSSLLEKLAAADLVDQGNIVSVCARRDFTRRHRVVIRQMMWGSPSSGATLRNNLESSYHVIMYSRDEGRHTIHPEIFFPMRPEVV